MATKVVIVPGFAESQAHFKPLIHLLHKHGYKTEVLFFWQTDLLLANAGRAVFVGHSLGAYYLAHLKLTPSLLIGLPEPKLVTKYFGKSFFHVSNHSFKNKRVKDYSLFRLANIVSFVKNFVPLVRFGYIFYKNKLVLETNNENIILLQNKHDPLVKKVVHSKEHQGHHDDVLYNPKQYIAYIETLANKM